MPNKRKIPAFFLAPLAYNPRMLSAAQQILQDVFGYAAFRGLQAEVIGAALAGQDALVLMPTGAGKSLCYQVPALVLEGTAIVVSPLIALMEDQVTALQQLGVNADYLNSTLDMNEARRIERALLDGELDLLYVAPERLTTPRFLQLLMQCQGQLALFAIDEAHCVSQWGHDFRPEYQRLSVLHEHFPSVPRMALTATADEQTRKDIITRLQLQQARQFVSGFDRPNIRYTITLKNNPRQQLLHFINTHHRQGGVYDAGIVYCLSRKRVEQTAEFLQSKGLSALPYHAGLPAQTRQQNQQRFINEEGIVMVATIAFGMGIDKPNVRFVGHLDLPKSLEAYYQETGRAGRDGLPANAWMAYGLQDVINLRQMLDGGNASDEQKRIERQKLEAMLGLCEVVTCRRQALLDYFGDHLEQACGNCDNCLNTPETWDATEAAQKAMSCVYRTGQRYGVNYLISVLLGVEDDDTQRRGHRELGVFGIGKGMDKNQWRAVYRQLVARGFLSVDVEGWGSLRLTEKARPILRGEQSLQLRKDAKPARLSSVKAKAQRRLQRAEDQQLWEALRECRMRLAQEQNVPPYVIFHDATLMAMVEMRPDNLSAFSHISGVGERKLHAYGETFLQVIAAHRPPEPSGEGQSDTVSDSINLFRLGMDAAAIASQRELSETTVHNHLAQGVEEGVLALDEVLPLSAPEVASIQDALLQSGQDDNWPLKPVFEQFSGTYDYPTLNYVRAALRAK